MQWDAEDPAARARHRDRALHDYARQELGVYTPYYRARLKALHLDPRRVRSLEDLKSLGVVGVEELIEDPDAFLVHPRLADLTRSGDHRLALSLALGRLRRRLDRVNRQLVEPRYKPIVWLSSGAVPLGYTDTDLEALAEAGSRVLSLAGLDRNDVLVGLTEVGDAIGHWQLVLGARKAGLTALHLGPKASREQIVEARPTVLAGSVSALLRALGAVTSRGPGLSGVRVLLVVGEDPDAGQRDALSLAGEASIGEAPSVVATWAPDGARAQWGECPAGAGFHTFPDLEIVEVGRGGAAHATGAGEIVWSALGWRGTVVFRLATGTRAELVDGTCQACGRKGPRVVTGTRDGLDVAASVEAQPGVDAFQIDLSLRDGEQEVVVFVAPSRGVDVAELVEELDESLGATQYIVLSRRALDARVTRDGTRILDRRADLREPRPVGSRR